LASDAQQFAVLARHVRPGGTAITTRYVADRETLARAGVTGVNFQLPMAVSLLDRLAAAVVAGTIVPPPITRIRLDEVPDLVSRHGHAEGKTVIIM
jgi:NADPH2:quinone reductase